MLLLLPGRNNVTFLLPVPGTTRGMGEKGAKPNVAAFQGGFCSREKGVGAPPGMHRAAVCVSSKHSLRVPGLAEGKHSRL